MEIVGNSTGIAPDALKRSLSTLACSRVRVTRIRLPCRGNTVTLASDMRTLLHLCRINSVNDFIGPLRQRLLGQLYPQLLSQLDIGSSCPFDALTHPYLASS